MQYENEDVATPATEIPKKPWFWRVVFKHHQKICRADTELEHALEDIGASPDIDMAEVLLRNAHAHTGRLLELIEAQHCDAAVGEQS